MKSIQILLASASLLLLSGHCLAQTTSSEFQVRIVEKGNDLIMTCHQGCAWKTLTLSGSYGQAVTYTDTYLYLDKNISQDEEAKFEFTLTRSSDNLKLEAVSGVLWKELNFSIGRGEKWELDQSGVHNIRETK